MRLFKSKNNEKEKIVLNPSPFEDGGAEVVSYRDEATQTVGLAQV